MENKLYTKLFEVKKKIGKISKEAENPFFKSKYFDINKLLEHVEPLLEEAKLLCLQPIQDGCVSTKIYDLESEDMVMSEIKLPELTDPQKLGSAITYYRRYTLQSLLGLQAEDDDGNKASTTQAAAPSKNTQDDEKPWLNITLKGGKDHTEEAKAVYLKIRDGQYNSVFDIRKDYKVSKVIQATLEAWIKSVKTPKPEPVEQVNDDLPF